MAVCIVASQVATLPQALVAIGVIGLANGGWTALAVPLLVDLVPQERAAEMTGLGSAVWSLAQPIGAVFAGLLIASADSYRVSFVGAAVFIFLCRRPALRSGTCAASHDTMTFAASSGSPAFVQGHTQQTEPTA